MVSIPDAADLDFTTAVTIEAWVNPSAAAGWRTVVLKERAGGLAYALYGSDDASRPTGYIYSGGADREATGSTSLPLNVWSHVAMTYNGATLRLFVNGVEVRSQAHSGSIAVSGSMLRIGGNTVWGEFFAGRIDEVRIYNRALTAAEIQSDMELPVSGS